MTSLLYPPTHGLVNPESLSDGKVDESIFAVWRASRNAKLVRKRLSNRSWRLISERVINGFQRGIDKSCLMLQDQPFTCTDTLPCRPSLFLGLSIYASDSILSPQNLRCSDTGLVSSSGEESSDISDDESFGGEYFDYEHLQGRSHVILKLPCGSHNHHQRSIPKQAYVRPPSPARNTPNHNTINPTKFTTHTKQDGSESDVTNGDGRKGSIFYISNSPYLQYNEKNDFNSSRSQDALPTTPPPLERKDSLFRCTASMCATSVINYSCSLSSTDISEVDDTKDRVTSVHQEDMSMKFAGVPSSKLGNAKLLDDTESEWMSVSSDREPGLESPILNPISFNKRVPVPQPGSADVNSSPPLEETRKSSPSPFRPKSLLSGLLFNEINTPSLHSPVPLKSGSVELARKPVLKRSSTSGIVTVDSSKTSRGMQRPSLLFSRRYASSGDFTNNVRLHFSPIVYVAEQGTFKEDSPVPSERNLLVKQRSSVGLSNYLATAQGKRHSTLVDLASSGTHIVLDAHLNEHESLLSTNLSKYSLASQRQGSLKRIFSKSSISLTSLLGHSISEKLRLHSDIKSNEISKAINAYNRLHNLPPVASLFVEHHSQQNLTVLTTSESIVTTGVSVRVEPKVATDFTPSVEISESVRDSLLIDYKLGKAPLPDRVISDEDLFIGHDKEIFLPDPNDYHSKGW